MPTGAQELGIKCCHGCLYYSYYPCYSWSFVVLVVLVVFIIRIIRVIRGLLLSVVLVVFTPCASLLA